MSWEEEVAGKSKETGESRENWRRGIIRQEKRKLPKGRREGDVRKREKKEVTCGERGEEKLERRIRAASAVREKERARERASEMEGRRGRRREEEGESWQLLGACGVGPFKARSPDARRRNCPPRVARALHVPLRHVPSGPSNVAAPRSPWYFLSAPPPTPSREEHKPSRRASMKSHPPRISPFLLPNLLLSLPPFSIPLHPPSLPCTPRIRTTRKT